VPTTCLRFKKFGNSITLSELFVNLLNFISGPMMALCLAREDAVEGWREMLGPKEVEVAKEQAPER